VVVSTVVLTGVAGSRIHTLSQSNKATDLGGGGVWRGGGGIGENWEDGWGGVGGTKKRPVK